MRIPPPTQVTEAALGAAARLDDTPHPRRWLVFAVVGLALLMTSIVATSVATALSALQTDLGTSLAWGGWTITVYSLGQIVALPIAGRLADQFGRKRVFITAIAVFTAGSLACGLASGIEWLIVFRLVQGLAGGAFLPAATGLVAEWFGADRDRATALFTSVVPIGAIIGPVVGGIIVTTAGWREIFLVNVPIGMVVLLAVALLVHETPRSSGEQVDLVGVALLVTMLLAGMSAVTLLSSPRPGWIGYITAGLAALIAVAGGWLQLRHARTHPAPLIPIRLLRGHGFGAMNLVNIMFGMGALGLSALVPHYAELRYGIAPLVAGGLLGLRAIGMIAASVVAVGLIRRLGYRPLLLTGTGLLAVGLTVLALPAFGVTPQVWLGGGALICGLGMGMGAPASSNGAMHLAADQIGAVSGLRSMFRQIGGIIGISVTTAVVSAAAAPATANAWAFAVLAVILVASLPVILRVPNHRGRW